MKTVSVWPEFGGGWVWKPIYCQAAIIATSGGSQCKTPAVCGAGTAEWTFKSAPNGKTRQGMGRAHQDHGWIYCTPSGPEENPESEDGVLWRSIGPNSVRPWSCCSNLLLDGSSLLLSAPLGSRGMLDWIKLPVCPSVHRLMVDRGRRNDCLVWGDMLSESPSTIVCTF